MSVPGVPIHEQQADCEALQERLNDLRLRLLRTIIVLTRLSVDRVSVTYLNDLQADRPYILSMVWAGGPPPVGVSTTDLPFGIGDTRVVVNR